MTWICKDCGTNNEDSMKFCVVCGAAKGAPFVSASPSSSVKPASAADRLKPGGVWVCKECNTNNEASATECIVCGGTERLEPTSAEVVSVRLTKSKAAALEIEGGVLTIPEGYEEIDAHAFENNSKLETVILPSSMKKIFKEAFKNCRNLKEVRTGGTLDSIGEKAFFNCTSLIVKPTARVVKDYAFSSDHSSVKPSSAPTKPSSAPAKSTSYVAPKPKPSTTSSTTKKTYKSPLNWWQILLIVLGSVAVVTAIVLLSVFGSIITWGEWQQIIGSIVGAILTAVVIIVSYVVYEKTSVMIETYQGCMIGATVVGFINMIFGFTFENGYNIIFYWIGAYALVGLIVTTIIAYSEGKDKWAYGGLISTVANAVFFVIITTLTMTLFIGHAEPPETEPSTTGQWVAGILFGGAFAVGMFFAIMYIEDSTDKGGIFAAIVTSVLTIINLSVAAALGINCKIIFNLFSVALILAAGSGGFWSIGADDIVESFTCNLGVIALNISMMVILNIYMQV